VAGTVEPSKRAEASVGAARRPGYPVAVVEIPLPRRRDGRTSTKVKAATGCKARRDEHYDGCGQPVLVCGGRSTRPPAPAAPLPKELTSPRPKTTLNHGGLRLDAAALGTNSGDASTDEWGR
jgi:hypothetical protein